MKRKFWEFLDVNFQKVYFLYSWDKIHNVPHKKEHTNVKNAEKKKISKKP